MNQASDHYVQRLDLGADPFAPGFPSNYFYNGAERRQLLDQIVHLCRFGDHVIVITGATGSGTSTLLDATFARLQPLMDCCHINAQLDGSPNGILESLSEQLRLHLDPPFTTNQVLRALEAGCDTTIEQEPILLAIDQTHYMDVEGLECLLELFQRARGLVSLVLVGEYQIQQLAELAGFVPDRLKVFEIAPLTLSETDEYLMGVLGSVGYAGSQPLSSDQLAVLHEQSGGNIGDINRLVPSLLLEDTSKADKQFGLAIPATHLTAIAILVLALLISYFYQADDEEPVENDRVSKEIAVLPVLRKPTETPIDSTEALTAVDAEETLSITQPQPVLNTGTDNADALVRESVDEPVLLEQGSPIVSDTTDTNSTAGVAIKTPAAAISEPQIEQTVVQHKPTVLSNANTEQAVSKVAVKPATDKAVKQNQLAPTIIVPREQRLMNLPVTGYMLQLLGSVDEKRSREFVKQYIGRLPVTYIELTRKGKPWYVVLAGPYDDRAAAIAAVNHLPAVLQKQKPWARSIVSIQKDIQRKSQ